MVRFHKIGSCVARGAGIAAILLLAACASDAEKQVKPSPLTAIDPQVVVQKVWQADVGSSQGTFLRPVVLENAIYAASGDGDLARLDPSTGKQVWQIRIDGGVSAGVGSDGLVVAVASARGTVTAVDAGAKRLWEAQVPSDVVAPPVVGHDLVLVRSTDNRVTAFDAKTGERRWTFQKQQPALTLRAEAEMALSGDNLLIGFPGGRLTAVALSNGAARWEAGVSEPKGATEVERLADVLGLPVLSDDEVCANSYQGRIACFESRSGDLRWAREFNAGAGAAGNDKLLIGVSEQSHVSAFSRAGGGTLWQNAALANRRLSAPVVIGDWTMVGDLDGYLHVLRLEDGRLAGRLDLGEGPVISTPQLLNGRVLLQTARGRLCLIAIARIGADRS